MSAVAISWPLMTTPESTLVCSRFLSRSMFMRVRPAESHSPFRNSRLSRSMLFLNSSRWTRASEHCATASESAAMVEFDRLGGMFCMMKKLISVWPSSLFPDPLGPKRFSMGNALTVAVTTSRNSVAMRKHSPILALSPNTRIMASATWRKGMVL